MRAGDNMQTSPVPIRPIRAFVLDSVKPITVHRPTNTSRVTRPTERHATAVPDRPCFDSKRRS
jgi:hypothetical protein